MAMAMLARFACAPEAQVSASALALPHHRPTTVARIISKDESFASCLLGATVFLTNCTLPRTTRMAILRSVHRPREKLTRILENHSDLATGDSPVHRVAYSDIPAGIQAQVVYKAVHSSLLGALAFPERPLELRCVHHHLLHCQHIHQCVCIAMVLILSELAGMVQMGCFAIAKAQRSLNVSVGSALGEHVESGSLYMLQISCTPVQ